MKVVGKLAFSFLFFVVGFQAIQGQEISSTIADSSFVNIKNYSSDFEFEMKYATSDNFLKEKVYDCGECYLRLKTVKALIVANNAFKELGYKIKIFDCYRPLSIQKKMWQLVPNPSYVANPSKGSIHNRGGAVDITLIDFNGVVVDFGTPFDYFGKEAAHSFKKIPKKVRNNRKFLKKIMENNGFKAIESEWWHYEFSGALTDPVSNFIWKCD